MKTMKLLFVLIAMLITTIIFTECEKKEIVEPRPNNTGFWDSLNLYFNRQIDTIVDISMGTNGYAFNTIYQAPTDGFVTAWINADDDEERGYLTIYANETSPPNTVLAETSVYYGVYSEVDSFTVPIKKDDYWKVEKIDLTGVQNGICNGDLSWTSLD